MPTWTLDASMRYLNACPLPPEFTWPHRDGGERPVQPSHSMVTGYGKWLRETPYFPGLFELCHDILDEAGRLPSAVWEERFGEPGGLAKQIRVLRKSAGLLDREPGREALAHRLRPLVWQRDQCDLPLNL